MSNEQRIALCKIYNNSDIEAFDYMNQFCNKEQLETLDRIVTLNNETAIGWGREDYTSEELDEYYNKKWQLLNAFGIDNIYGDAYVDGVMYQ